MDPNNSMNMDLAAVYNTPGGPSQEDIEKAAEATMFAKLAADNNIDLNQLNDEQVLELYNQTFSKEAEGVPPQFAKKDGGDEKKEEKKEEKKDEGGKAACPADGDKEAAAREFELQKEAQVKLAEADYLGRVMAHSFTQELGLIGDSMNKEAAPTESPAVVELSLGKEASALDKLAAKHAMVKAAKAGHDVGDTQRRIEAIFTLGVKPSEKVASAENVQQGTEIRALELLEQAGFEINWSEDGK